MSELEEGDELKYSDLPESEMTNSGKWELVDGITLSGEVDGDFITLEFSKVKVTDVTPIDELMDDE